MSSPPKDEVVCPTRTDMKKYWEVNAKNSSIEEMMLDTNAKVLTQRDHPEVMAILPNITGLRVLELGAGIGRFTGDLATCAAHVTAVDFIDEYIKKNEQENGVKYPNIDFQCGDATVIQFNPGEFDVVFSNWLLMYLTDNEVQALANNMLRWIKPGGYIFFRESCFRSSGNIKPGSNPTQYRSLGAYQSFFESAVEPIGDGRSYSLEFVVAKNIHAYVEQKGNPNQICWLWHKIVKPANVVSMFRIFLDSDQYSFERILCTEKLFGNDGYVCPGGSDVAKNMAGKVDLQTGKKVLEVGSGMGRGALYMAQTFNVDITGVDLSVNMSHLAFEMLDKVKLKNIHFEISDIIARDYPEQSFDAVISRDTLMHITDKKMLLSKLYAWLKPKSRIVITDYCLGTNESVQDHKMYLEKMKYNLVSVDDYLQVFTSAGFSDISFSDNTAQFIQYITKDLQRAEECKDEFLKDFTEECYQETVSAWKTQLKYFTSGSQSWVEFSACKK
ncbi:uncharacterized protein [Dysidea avara]|uniref:uncharacterized protein isoform X2 n=1 Tax=Dysidea avara TaxID=196820 RepID=UPI003318332E